MAGRKSQVFVAEASANLPLATQDFRAWHATSHPETGLDLSSYIARQMIRSAGSIPANIEEGFGRGFGKDYAHFLRIALGSAREPQGGYFRGRHLLPNGLLQQRLRLLDQIIAGLIATSNQQRRR